MLATVPSFLLGAFGAGLLALLTPCVFPMIPVTLAFFTKQATGKDASSSRSIVGLAATYALGIVVAFTLLGALTAAFVGAAGANRLASNPWTNIAFGVFFLFFALSMMEIIEIRPPAALQRAQSGMGKTLGVLGMGLTFVVGAFTCTAPFIGTVLVAAAKATTASAWFLPVAGMAVFALALALPFFLLALFPGLLARLPKSGGWLTTIKGAMGFLELAAALKFFSNADIVWKAHILTQPVLLSLWALIAVLGALWLNGALHLNAFDGGEKITPARRVWAGVFGLAALYCLWGISGRPLGGVVVAFLPPSDYTLVADSGDKTVKQAVPVGELTYLSDMDAALAQAKAENKPIFIDFTGYTCINCRWMEKNVFPKTPVPEELNKFVRVRLYTDGGADGPKNAKYQEKTFGDVSLPLYALLGPDGKPVAQSAGVTRDPQQFAQFLQKAQTN